MKAVLITRRLPGDGVETIRRRLGGAGWGIRHWNEDDPIPRSELLRQAAGVSGILCLLTDRIDAEVYEAAGPDLRVVSTMAVGYDHIDVLGATRHAVMVTNTPGVLTETTADLCFALILGACRRAGEAVDNLQRLQWTTWRTLELAGRDVHGATLGIVGAGRIGQAVGRRAVGFSMRVIYHSRRPDPAFEAETGAAFRPGLDELLREADIVTLHVPLTAETRHLIGRRELELMKPTAVLVNTSRGPVVDEAALAEALAANRIFAAGLDVYETEPLPPASPLRQLPNAYLLPHVGSATIGTRTRMADLAVHNLLEALEGRRPPSLVNPEVMG